MRTFCKECNTVMLFPWARDSAYFFCEWCSAYYHVDCAPESAEDTWCGQCEIPEEYRGDNDD